MLMPAGVLVVLLLGAIAFDLSLVFLRQRQASSVAVDVANDLASAALDEEALPRRRRVPARPRASRRARAADLVAASDLGEEVIDVEVSVLGDDTVEVRVVAQVDYVFAKAIPGASDGTTVTASATAVATPA